VVIGGYNPVEEVYAYDPLPKTLAESKTNYILGAQANLWTEYIHYPSKVEYMVFPRMSALAEVLWTPKENRNWSQFEKNLQTQFKRYDLWKANYSKAYFDVKIVVGPAANYQGLSVSAMPRDNKGRLYVVTAKDSTLFTKARTLKNTEDLVLYYYRGQQLVNKIPLSVQFNKATGKKVSITKASNERYPGQLGAFGLVNGVFSKKGLSSPDWLGWIGDDLEATIDLGKPTTMDSVAMHTLNQNGSWIYLPQYVEVLTSIDGKNYTSAGKSSDFVKDTLTSGWITVRFNQLKARYVKVIAKNYGLIPDGQAGGGTKAWLFADEIKIN
jgi:hexosaminidase